MVRVEAVDPGINLGGIDQTSGGRGGSRLGDSVRHPGPSCP